MDYSIRLGVQLDKTSLSGIKTELKNQLQTEKINIKTNSKDLNDLRDIKDLLNNIYLELGRIEKAGINFKGVSSSAKDINNLNKGIENTEKKIKNANFATSNWAYNWSKAMQSFLTYNTVTQVFNQTVQAIQDMVTQVKELDDALTELKKVTDLEGESLEKFVERAYESGREVAKTGTEMVEAATEFAKAGYDEEQILQLGKIANMYTNIADEEISAADSAEFIIAQMKAFNVEAENAEHIIDAVNEVSNNFAVSSADIATNLGKSSAVMANAGNSMEQMIGLLTAGTEITRNASKVSNGLKTLTLRLQGMNDEGEKDIEVQAQMEALFNKLGISVYDANGELKNTFDILKDLAPVYKTLDNAQKAYVTETIAGKYQAQNAAAILNNFEVAIKATETAMNSQGSAAEENSKVLESVEGHLQQLRSSWEELSTSILSSDLLKGIIDVGTTILNIANSDFGKFIAMTAATYMGISILRSHLEKATNAVNSFSVGLSKNSIQLILNNTKVGNLDKSLQKKIKNILKSRGAYDNETKSISKSTIAEIKNTLAKNGVSKAEQGKIINQLTSKKVTEGLTAATIAQTVAQEALNVAMTMGISLLIEGGISLISSLINSSKEEAEAAAEIEEDLRSKAVEAGDALIEKNQSLDEYINQYKSLKKELDSESTSYSRSVELRSEILDLQADINKLLGDENGGIDLINDSLDETIRKQNEIKKQAADDYMAANATAVHTAEDNLKKNYYGGKRNKIMSYEWTWNGEKIGDERWNNITDAMLDALGDFSLSGSFGWGGKDENRHGFDKEYFYDFADDVEMTAQEAKDLWGRVAKDIETNKESYMESFNLSEDDYKILQQSANENYKAVSDYINKQQEVLDKAAEAMVYSDDTYYQKLQEIQAAQAEYNKAKAEGDEEGAQTAIEKITNLQKYVEGLDNDTVKNYFKDILKEWQDDINKNKVKDSLAQLSSDIKNSLLSKNITGDNFRQIFEQYQKGITTGLDENQLSLLNSLNTAFQQGGYSIEDFTSYLEKLGIIGKSTNTVIEETKSTLSTLGDSIKSVEERYSVLTGAVDEFNENGYITASTFQSLVDNNLLDYLQWTSNGLQANTKNLINEADALKINALATLQESYAKDVLAIANGDLASGTPYLTAALNDEKDGLSGLGDLAKAQTGGLFDLAKAQAAVQAAGGNLDVDKYGDQLNKLNNYYNNLAQSIANINIGKNPSSTYKGGNSSSSSSKEKEWWEQQLDNLKDRFDNNEITIEEYINGLDGLLGQLDKGSDAWNKVNKELQKQRLDKIKDDYDAGRLSLEQYIKELEKLQQAYRAGTEGWKDLAAKIKDAKLDLLKEQEDDLNTALDAVDKTLEKQIDDYEDLKDAADKRYEDELDNLEDLQEELEDQDDKYQQAQQAVLDYLDAQSEALNSQKESVEEYYDTVLDALEKMNDEQERANALAEAYEALMNAMTQKSKKVYKEGLGWVWEADQEAIKEAKKNYEDLLNEQTIADIEQQRDDAVGSLEDQIEALEKYVESWDEVLEKFTNESNRNMADLLLGENWEEMVDKLDPQIVEDFSDAYYELQKNLDEAEKQIEDLNKRKEEEDEYWDKLIDDLEEYKDQWDDVADIYKDAQDKLMADQILGANWEKDVLEKRLDVLENFKNRYNALLAEIDKVDNMTDDQASGYSSRMLKSYSQGGEVDYTGLAMVHGSPSRPEYVLNNTQMRNLLSNMTRPQIISNYNKTSNPVINNYNFGDIELPNVNNAQQFINELKSIVNITKHQ